MGLVASNRLSNRVSRVEGGGGEGCKMGFGENGTSGCS